MNEKKLKKIRMARSNSLLSSTFDFQPEDILDKSIQLDLTKTSEEKILDSVIEKLPNIDNCYAEHREETNAFLLRRDKKQE